MERKKRNGGFTLAELLVVVAIIAVLVAIAIPVFSSQLEKAREATDLANIRSTYAEIMTAVVSEDTDADTTKALKLPNDTYLEGAYQLKSNNDVYVCKIEENVYTYVAIVELKHNGEWELENVEETLKGLNENLTVQEYIQYEGEPLYAVFTFYREESGYYFYITITDEKTLSEDGFF